MGYFMGAHQNEKLVFYLDLLSASLSASIHYWLVIDLCDQSNTKLRIALNDMQQKVFTKIDKTARSYLLTSFYEDLFGLESKQLVPRAGL